ncbi:response regulator [Spirulina subsalsa]|uniref:response regulator n=1 Tax=Spirulina subsalsa TaxID=54311 RepID=UPI00030CFBCA|nr:response regulator [Spirulina subsalsa]
MSNKTLLVIDDEERILEVVKACLEDLGGWNTITVQSSQEGLQRLDKDSFDAILLDISMPDLDGFQFFDQLQQNNSRSQTPVILLTAKALPEDREKFAQMGIAGVITKPFNPLTLCDRVADFLGWDVPV